MEKRKKRIRDTCRASSASSRKFSLPKYDFLVDYEHGMGYCRHGKVATSSILSYFLMMSSNVDNKTKAKWRGDIEALHDNLNSIFPGQRRFETPSGLVSHLRERGIVTFSFVRHPFER